MKILDPLRNQLQKTYTVELFGDVDNRELLLREKSDRMKQRLILEKKVEELQKAAITLGLFVLQFLTYISDALLKSL